MPATTHAELFPLMEEVKKEFAAIDKAKLGDPSTPFAATKSTSTKVNCELNKGLSLPANAASIFQAYSYYFSRDNVGLPGVALYFKVLTQVELAEGWAGIEFLAKRDHLTEVPGAAKPELNFPSKDKSDVLHAFECALALSRVAYEQAQKLHNLAVSEKDGEAQEHIGCCLKQAGAKLGCISHEVAHLKAITGGRSGGQGSNKHAIKTFDRRLPFIVEPLACAAGLEAVIPCRLQEGPINRALCKESSKMQSPCDITAHPEVFARVVA
eukprot:jgi/Astpho2/6041/fgenesh1_pg.00084_%23_42_t